jgi:hypothetical protein
MCGFLFLEPVGTSRYNSLQIVMYPDFLNDLLRDVIAEMLVAILLATGAGLKNPLY